jgi:hypothetical protein
MRSQRWAVMAGALAWAAACGGRVLVDKNDESSTHPGAGGSPSRTSFAGSSFTGVTSSGTSGSRAAGGSTGTTTPGGPFLGASGALGTGGVASVPPVASTAKPPPPATPPPPPPPPPPTDGDGGVIDYVLAGVTNSGEILAAFWNGSYEEIVLVDPATSHATEVGKLGNLQSWPSQFIYDSKATAYAVGQDARFAKYVYSFALEDRKTTTTPIDAIDASAGDYMLGGVTSSGVLVTVYGVGAVYYLDPKTGTPTHVGDFDGMTSWQGELVYDDAKRTVYAIGNSGSFVTFYLFSLNLDTGKKTRSYLGAIEGGMINYVLGGLTQDGRLVGAYWDGTAEKAILVEPVTGSVDIVGTFGNLRTWSGQLVYGGVPSTAFAYGRDPSESAHFYRVVIGK